jgi:basic membrane lipoprotein Med (substrate-binding protein (PBP1-ABC) superfamily)
VHVRFIEPGEGSDREAGLRLLAAEGMDLVIGVGFIFTDDLTQLAKEYPNTKFAGVDYAVQTDAQGNPIPPPPNLAALKFREEQGSSARWRRSWAAPRRSASSGAWTFRSSTSSRQAIAPA